MASRPVWKGQIRLSLVSIPVEIYAATTSGSAIAFRQIHRESGKRIHYQKVAEGIGPVDADEIIKGYEVEKDEYVLLTDEEIEGVKLETKKTLELVQFVDSHEIPPLYFDKPYYVVPQDDLAEDAFRVVRDALRQAKKTGLGQLSMRGKEYLVALRPCSNGLLLETLRYEDEVRKSDGVFADISEGSAEDDLLSVASELIKRKSSPFKASNFKNHYTEALKRLIAEKRKAGGEDKLVIMDESSDAGRGKSNVIDLMAALKKSLESGGSASEEDDDGAGSGAEAATSRSKAARRPRAATAKAKAAKTSAAKPAVSKSTAARGPKRKSA
ncbi:DNA repair protein [Aureimonas sp. Leaf454]|uniref:non-homologous end joining protein Ku n=1 Tax=Aureimonas sp. Leaf454 TaxID=1736381 RepID=UPI0006F45B6A|nr:Ku protein [Aureimonas sp. Leaf454]KQT54217.1 DNA repair protein [Aureimonas sp. Leaf454]